MVCWTFNIYICKVFLGKQTKRVDDSPASRFVSNKMLSRWSVLFCLPWIALASTQGRRSGVLLANISEMGLLSVERAVSPQRNSDRWHSSFISLLSRPVENHLSKPSGSTAPQFEQRHLKLNVLYLLLVYKWNGSDLCNSMCFSYTINYMFIINTFDLFWF